MPPPRTVAPHSPPQTHPGAQNSRSAQAASTPFHTRYQPPRAHLRRRPPPHQSDRPLPQRDLRPVTHLGGPRTHKPRPARRHHHPQDHRRHRTPTPPTGQRRRPRDRRTRGGGRRLRSQHSEATPAQFHPETGTPPVDVLRQTRWCGSRASPPSRGFRPSACRAGSTTPACRSGCRSSAAPSTRRGCSRSAPRSSEQRILELGFRSSSEADAVRERTTEPVKLTLRIERPPEAPATPG